MLISTTIFAALTGSIMISTVADVCPSLIVTVPEVTLT